MSPLWRDEIGVLITPRRLVFARMGRGLQPRRMVEARAQVDGGRFANWEPALAVLREQLGQPAWTNANVRVVVADQWVRYMIVPWEPDLKDEAERVIHARHLLAQAYGDMEDWTLTLSEAAAMQCRVATAIPTALLSSLASEFAASGSRVVSTQPRLIAAFNQAAPRLPQAACWFVAVDDGSLAAAHATPQGWDRVHAIRIGSDWNTELKRLRLFGRMVGGHENEERVFVDAPAWLRPAANDGDDGLEWLEVNDPPDRSTAAQLAWLQAQTV